MLKIVLDRKCNICRSTNLILIETEKYVEVQCPNCGIGLRLDKKYVRDSIKVGNLLRWKYFINSIVLDFYKSSPTILRIRSVRKFDKSTNILENVG